MNKPDLSLFLLILIVLSLFCCALFAEPNEPNLVWGPEVNGLQAAIEFVPEKELYSQGEIVGIFFHIRNTSEDRLQFVTSIWRNDDQCVVEDCNGRESSCSCIRYLGWPRMVRIIVEPYETWRMDSSSFGIGSKKTEGFKHPVGCWARLEPGMYSLRYELKFPDIRGTELPPKQGDWTGTLETGKRLLVVKAAEREPNSPGKL